MANFALVCVCATTVVAKKHATGGLPSKILREWAERANGDFGCEPHVAGSEVAAEVDWTHIMSPVRDQGYCGSCYAFSAIATMEAAAAIDLSKKVELSEMQVIECTATDPDVIFGEHAFDQSRPQPDPHPEMHVVGGCAGGWEGLAMMHFTLRGAAGHSASCACSRSSYQYQGDLLPMCNGNAETCFHVNGEVYREPIDQCAEASCDCALPAGSVESCYEVLPWKVSNAVESLKEALNHRPIAISINSGALDGIQDGDRRIVSGKQAECGGQDTDHAVVAVGYGEEAGVEYWKIRNSWGAQWADNGYVRVEILHDEEGSLCMNTGSFTYPKMTGWTPGQGRRRRTSTTAQPTEAPSTSTTSTTSASTAPPSTTTSTTANTVASSTTTSTTSTSSSTSPEAEHSKRCRACNSVCLPCKKCLDSDTEECHACWRCWDWEKNKKKDSSKSCHAMSSKHSWDSVKAQCLDEQEEDCRSCWGPGLVEV